MGNLLHKTKELCSTALMQGKKPDYDALEEMTRHSGWIGMDKNSGKTETLLSASDLKTQFFEDWMRPDDKSGLTYEQKLAIFFEHLPDEENDTEWETIGVEVPFEFEPRKGVLIKGFIDKVQENSSGKLRIVDYKSSKAVYDSKKLTTPLQLFIYHLACQKLYPGKEIVEYMYDFVLLGEQQLGGTKGWLARAEKKLNKLLDGIEKREKTGVWEPKPTPLCFWCSFCENNPNASDEFNHCCPYYSLWTPGNKVFSVKNPWNPDDKGATERLLKSQKTVEEFRW